MELWAAMFELMNEVNRGKKKVSNKVLEIGYSGFWHVERRSLIREVKRVEKLRVKGNKGREKPKKEWKNCVSKDLRETNIWREVRFIKRIGLLGGHWLNPKPTVHALVWNRLCRRWRRKWTSGFKSWKSQKLIKTRTHTHIMAPRISTWTLACKFM